MYRENEIKAGSAYSCHKLSSYGMKLQHLELWAGHSSSEGKGEDVRHGHTFSFFPINIVVILPYKECNLCPSLGQI